jgi:FkbM family methyltransferase
MNPVLKKIIFNVFSPYTRENWAVSLMNSIGYGETSILSESEQFLSALSNISFSKFVILDIGASYGDYSLEILNGNNKVIVYAFEPSEVAASKFARNLVKYIENRRCYINNFGIGEKTATLDMYSNFDGSPGASLHKRKGNDQLKKTAKILKFDKAIADIKLPIVGMKIDTEGQELPILLSARKLLQSKNFKVVQFEFGEYTIEKSESFKEYFDYLSRLGFEIFRMSKFGITEITEYKPRLEVHWNTSYLAIKK